MKFFLFLGMLSAKQFEDPRDRVGHAIGEECDYFSECQDNPDQCCGTATYIASDGKETFKNVCNKIYFDNVYMDDLMWSFECFTTELVSSEVIGLPCGNSMECAFQTDNTPEEDRFCCGEAVDPDSLTTPPQAVCNSESLNTITISNKTHDFRCMETKGSISNYVMPSLLLLLAQYF